LGWVDDSVVREQGDRANLARSEEPQVPTDVQDRALRKLRQLDAAMTIDDLRNPPGNQLEALKGDRAGQMSIRINAQWRICFRWVDGDARDVEIADYH
jgi:proteic killer suppression protein